MSPSFFSAAAKKQQHLAFDGRRLPRETSNQATKQPKLGLYNLQQNSTYRSFDGWVGGFFWLLILQR
jgi:hypothetical protein